MYNQIERPYHYTRCKPEVWDIIIAWGLDYFLGNALKYVMRAGFKTNAELDIRKAREYVHKIIGDVELYKRANTTDRADIHFDDVVKGWSLNKQTADLVFSIWNGNLYGLNYQLENYLDELESEGRCDY